MVLQIKETIPKTITLFILIRPLIYTQTLESTFLTTLTLGYPMQFSINKKFLHVSFLPFAMLSLSILRFNIYSGIFCSSFYFCLQVVPAINHQIKTGKLATLHSIAYTIYYLCSYIYVY